MPMVRLAALMAVAGLCATSAWHRRPAMSPPDATPQADPAPAAAPGP
jgi:hypothetical protein